MIFSFLPTNKPLVGVLYQFIKLLNIRVTPITVEEGVLSHPEYPSMLALSDCLSQWDVDNIALRISSKQLSEIPTPFITFINNEFKLITQIGESKVSYLNDSGDSEYFDKNLFEEGWGGVVLIAEPNAQSGEQNFKQQEEKQKVLFFPLILMLILIVLSSGNTFFSFIETATLGSSIAFGILLVLKILGIIVSSLLLWYEIDKYNPALQKICGGSNKKVNCEAILSSNQSKLFSWLSWSEVGFIYFMGGFLSLILFFHKLNLIAWLNVAALPYIIFSIGYQWKVAKEWCPLCLTVQGLLFLEFIVALLGGLYYYPTLIDISSLTSTTFSLNIAKFLVLFLVPATVWYFAKPYLQQAKEGKNYKYELARLKNNPEIFNAILQKQEKMATSADGLGLVIGNSEATHTIIKVCNPYCNPCSEAHPELEKLILGNVKVQIIYNASTYEFDIGQKPVRYFLAVAEQKDQNQLMAILHEWYTDKNKDYEIFSNKYPLNRELEQQSSKIDAMYQWCNTNLITHTPTYFFDGYRLPSIYKLSDLTQLLK